MLEVRHLRYFLTVAEELHFSRAAERLHIAQPGLSQQIQALERDLGVRLLERTSRRVELTSAGRTLYQEGRRALASLEQAEALTRRVGHGEVGRLTLAATESATHCILPDLLREYRHRYPQVVLEIRQMATAAQTVALRRGDIDVGVMRTPAETEGLTTRTIQEDRLGMLVPEKHPLAARRTVSLSALRHEALVIFPSAPRPSWADFMLTVCRESGFEPRIAQEANDGATAVSFVAAGLGVTLVPEALSGLVRRGVIYRRVTGKNYMTELILAYRPQNVPETVTNLVSVVNYLWP
jgi:DNA-binding transcriptional LysR family regulator